MCEAEEVPHNLSLELQPGIWNWKPFVENVTQWLHFTENAPGGERVASHDKFVADPQLHSQLATWHKPGDLPLRHVASF